MRVASATSRRVGGLEPPNFNIDRSYDPAVARQWESYLADQTADLLSNTPENIDEHWSAINNALFSNVTQADGHVPEGRLKMWLTAEPWKRIDEGKGLKALLTAANTGGHDALELPILTEILESST